MNNKDFWPINTHTVHITLSAGGSCFSRYFRNLESAGGTALSFACFSFSKIIEAVGAWVNGLGRCLSSSDTDNTGEHNNGLKHQRSVKKSIYLVYLKEMTMVIIKVAILVYNIQYSTALWICQLNPTADSAPSPLGTQLMITSWSVCYDPLLVTWIRQKSTFITYIKQHSAGPQ